MGSIYLITLGAFLVALAGMAIGVLVSNRRIKGSCGGLAGFKDTAGNSICEACTNPSPECQGKSDAQRREATAAGAED